MFKIKIIILAISTILFVAFSTQAQDDPPQIQFIHNSADPALQVIDIYLNGNLNLNDFIPNLLDNDLNPVDSDVINEVLQSELKTDTDIDR